MKTDQNKYSGFTLIEMLIVMSIFIALLAIGIEAFSGLRSTIIMNQSIENFKQNVKWTQRAAVLLKRDPGEYWIYGVGLDLTNFYSPPYEYKIFKWCSTEQEYLDDIYAQGKFPQFIDGINLGVSDNGRINSTERATCNGPRGIRYIAATEGEGGLKGLGAVNDFKIPEPLLVGYKSSSAPYGNPRYVLYESVTGNVFYYDNNGDLVNYHTSDPYEETNPAEFILDFVLKPRNQDRGINVKINPVSGRVITESINGTELNPYYFP